MHKVWLYAPGENASKWDVCLSQNIMCIGWDEMGNLLEYASKKEMAARLQEIYDKPEASFKNDSLALWEFAHEMQAGDIVIVKKGQNQIIGRGIVEGDYAFDESFSDLLFSTNGSHHLSITTIIPKFTEIDTLPSSEV